MVYLSLITWSFFLLSKEGHFKQSLCIFFFFLTQFSINALSFLTMKNITIGGLRYVAITMVCCVVFTYIIKALNVRNMYHTPFLLLLILSSVFLLILIPFSHIHSFTMDGLWLIVACLDIGCFYPWKNYIRPHWLIASMGASFPISPLCLMGFLCNFLFFVIVVIVYLLKFFYKSEV